MESKDPLSSAATLDDLAGQLNELELHEGLKVLSVFGKAGDDPTARFNIVNYAFDSTGKSLKRLWVKDIPAGATSADADKASTPEAAQAIKDAFKKFIAPLMQDNEAVSRGEVFIGEKGMEVVVLRKADPLKPLQLGGTILKGSGDWGWTAEVIGNDIVVQNSKTTAFGGANDKADNGQTACGFPTKGHPELLGCALPLDGYAHTKGEHDALDGTPLPHMDFGLTSKGADRPSGAHVEVTDLKSGCRSWCPSSISGRRKEPDTPSISRKLRRAASTAMRRPITSRWCFSIGSSMERSLSRPAASRQLRLRCRPAA
jgi:hypothetical protein